jgi:hypothetical protein
VLVGLAPVLLLYNRIAEVQSFQWLLLLHHLAIVGCLSCAGRGSSASRRPVLKPSKSQLPGNHLEFSCFLAPRRQRTVIRRSL